MAEIVMVDPKGRECVVGTATEANDLRCRGYTRKPAPGAAPPQSKPATEAVEPTPAAKAEK